MYERTIRSEGVHEEEWGGSPGSGPTLVESKEVSGGGGLGVGWDGAALHNPSERKASECRGQAFPDRPDWIYAGLGVTGGTRGEGVHKTGLGCR